MTIKDEFPQFHQILPRNERGRDFVVGDIHGCFSLLEKGLAAIKFNEAADRLISVGDLVDRGMESHRALEFMEKPWFFAVRGNHEMMAVNVISAIMRESKSWEDLTERWYKTVSRDQLARLGSAILKLPYVIEFPCSAGQVGIVHAEVPLSRTWQSFTAQIRNGNYTDEATFQDKRISGQVDEAVPGIDRIFVGHRVQYPAPRRLGNIFYIDTGAYRRVLADEYGEVEDPRKAFALTIVEAAAPPERITAINPKKPAVDIRLTA